MAVARATARGYLASVGVAEPDAAVLLVSELVANAVLHPAVGTRSIELRVDVDGGVVHIEVEDADPRPPVARPHHIDDEFGRGLVIVERLAEHWGWAPVAGNGKKVWCDVSTDASTADRPRRQPTGGESLTSS